MRKINAQPETDDIDGMEPIAIIGIGCRFPGGASSPSRLWELLESGCSTQSTFPENRFRMASWYHPDPQRPGSISTTGGYFLSHDDGFREFDPSFFGINHLEAAAMDPQQRKLLEVVYESFESAGATLDELSGSLTACYVGCFTGDFRKMMDKDTEYVVPYGMTGSDMTILSNRVNYVFDLKGPSLTVDTSCSSSLYALHLACQSLLSGDCTAAVVGGTSVLMGIEQQIGAVHLGVLSPSSTCHSFDESADGFGRAEGISAIYIKKLSDAIANGDPIRAIIRSTAINSNGKGPGISHPSAADQERVIRRAYERAGLDFNQTGYFECHGTGTPVGDPIECTAVGNVFASGRSAENPLLIGSIKSNLGHTEGASGLASVIKVVLSLEHGIIPATVGIKKLNPNIDFKGGRLHVVRSNATWPEKLCRRASVNSFGYGGSNAHVIIDAADIGDWRIAKYFMSARTNPELGDYLQNDRKESDCAMDEQYLCLFSAHDHPTLLRNIAAISKVADKYDVRDLAYTLGAKRSKLSDRAFGIATTCRVSQGLVESKLKFGISRQHRPRLVFAFTGQGAQWPQMGYALLQYFPSVRRTFKELQAALDSLPNPPAWNLIDALADQSEDSTIKDAVRSQTLCAALQISIVKLLGSWSVHPSAVVGHSSGEVSTAFASGLLSASEAIRVAYCRGYSISQCHVPGAMMAVGLGAKNAAPYVQGGTDVVVACHNSPESATLSGNEEGIDKILASLKQDGIFSRKLRTSGNAYHSPLVRQAAQYCQGYFGKSIPKLAGLLPRSPTVPMYSCVTGTRLGTADVGIHHWRRNLEDPVLFDEAMQALLIDKPADLIIEIGPHSALSGPIRQIKSAVGIGPNEIPYLPGLIRGSNGVEDMLRLAGSLFVHNYPVDINAVNSSHDPVQKHRSALVDLPPYQWNYEGVMWTESRLSKELRFRSHCRHDLLGSRQPGSSFNEPSWRNILYLKHVPWLQDHKVGNDIIFPAAGYTAMAIEAIAQVAEDRGIIAQGYTLQNVTITTPLVLSLEGGTEILLNLRVLSGTSSEKWFDFRISSVTSEGKWTAHAAGMGAVEEINTASTKGATVKLRGHRGAHSIEASDRRYYSSLSALGIEYGTSFRVLADIRTSEDIDEAAARIDLRPSSKCMVQESRYPVHPTTLDGCLQLSVIAAHGRKKLEKPYLPVTIKSLTVWRYPDVLSNFENGTARGVGICHGLRSVHATSQAVDVDGRLLLEADVTFLSLEGSLGVSDVAIPRQPYARLVHKPDFEKLASFPLQKLFQNEATHEQLTRLIALLAHKEPRMHILEIGGGTGRATMPIMEGLKGRSSYPQYIQYTFTDISATALDEAKEDFADCRNMDFSVLDIERDPTDQGFKTDTFDLVIVSNVLHVTENISEALKRCQLLLKPGGRLIVEGPMSLGQPTNGLMLSTLRRGSSGQLLSKSGWHDQLLTSGFSGTDVVLDGYGEPGSPVSIIVSTVKRSEATAEPPNVTHNASEGLWLIYGGGSNPIIGEIEMIAQHHGIETNRVSLYSLPEQLPPRARVIMLVETENPLLSGMSNEGLTAIKALIAKASSCIWVTAGGLLNGTAPEQALVSGLAKSIMTEQPTLQISTFDIDTNQESYARSADLILRHELELRDKAADSADTELIERNGVVYISRYIVDEESNDQFARQTKPSSEARPLRPGLSLSFLQVGQVESYYFEGKPAKELTVPSDHVLIESQSFSMTKTEAMVLKGLRDSPFFSHECVGYVSRVGAAVTKLQQGDIVITLSPGKLDTSFVVPEEFCHRLYSNQETADLIGFMTPSCIALLALRDYGRIRTGDTVLIHAGADSLAVAAIQIAKTHGAKVIVAYNFETEKDFLCAHVNLPEDSFITVKSPSFSNDLGELTPGNSIDLVLSLSTSTNLQDFWTKVAPSGTLVLVGEDDLPAFDTFNMSVFLRGASIRSINLSEMLLRRKPDVNRLIGAVLELYRQRKLKSLTQQSEFDITYLPAAVKTVSQSDFYNRCSIRYTRETHIPIQVVDPLTFKPDASYLLVGCLGGLGRSLTMWMAARGARHFIFLSRSAADKPEAADLIQQLEDFSREVPEEMSIQVVRGDVSVREDVNEAVAAAKFPINGVVQAAMVLRDSLFESISLDAFNAVVRPKLHGSLNVHHALLDADLDFFVMTSSLLGTVGASTQSSYAAANAALDNIARLRWGLGLQATSVSLGMILEVGHVEAHPEVEQALSRNGGYAMSEDEFLHAMEHACRRRGPPFPRNQDPGFDPYAPSNLITGLDPTRLTKIRKTMHWLDDKRLRHIALAISAITASNSPVHGQSANSTENTTFILHHAAEHGESALRAAVAELVVSKFSSLVCIPVDKLSGNGMGRPLTDFGIDSMISADLRAWTWRVFKVDLSFAVLVGSDTSMERLVELVLGGMDTG